jgi:hypothetical protein
MLALFQGKTQDGKRVLESKLNKGPKCPVFCHPARCYGEVCFQLQRRREETRQKGILWCLSHKRGDMLRCLQQTQKMLFCLSQQVAWWWWWDKEGNLRCRHGEGRIFTNPLVLIRGRIPHPHQSTDTNRCSCCDVVSTYNTTQPVRKAMCKKTGGGTQECRQENKNKERRYPRESSEQQTKGTDSGSKI